MEIQEWQERTKLEAFNEGKYDYEHGRYISIDGDEDLDRLFAKMDGEIGVVR